MSKVGGARTEKAEHRAKNLETAVRVRRGSSAAVRDAEPSEGAKIDFSLCQSKLGSLCVLLRLDLSFVSLDTHIHNPTLRG